MAPSKKIERKKFKLRSNTRQKEHPLDSEADDSSHQSNFSSLQSTPKQIDPERVVAANNAINFSEPNESDNGENEAANQFITPQEHAQSMIKTKEEGFASNMEVYQKILNISSDLEGKNVKQLLITVIEVQKLQTAITINQNQIMRLDHEEIHKPTAKLLADLSSCKRRKIGVNPPKQEENAWKRMDTLIEVQNEEHEVRHYTRADVTKLVLFHQNGLWQEPKIGHFGLKAEIQTVLGRYFALLDEPRKLGYVVAQFLHRQDYFQQNFITKYYAGNARKTKEADGRNSVSNREKTLFSEIILFMGGNLLVQYPKVKGCGEIQPMENKRLNFVNVARDAVNQLGQQQKEGLAKTMRNLMEHCDGFVPIFEREEYTSIMEKLVNEDRQISQQCSGKENLPETDHQATPSSSRLFMNANFTSPFAITPSGSRGSAFNDKKAAAAKNALNAVLNNSDRIG